MDDTSDKPAGRRLALVGIACAVAGSALGWFFSQQSDGTGDKAAIEKIVHNYVLEHPEILPLAMENLRSKENSKLLAGIQGAVEKPYPGAVLGNPLGKVTLVEFTDFGCGYCRQSEADVAAMIAANPDLKVVIRQLPILSPASEIAARMGLAAAAQGKYAAFHHAIFNGGRLDGPAIQAAARTAGLDMARAERDGAAPQVAAEIEANMAFARKLGFQGTPSWVVGREVHSGAIGAEELARAIAKARN